MSSPHPRRRSKVPQSNVTPAEDMLPTTRPGPLPSLSTDMPLRRGATFNSPTTPPSEISHPIPLPSRPKRSETSKDLDVITGREARMAALISDIDRGISCSGSMSPGVRESLSQEALPLPRIVLDATVSELPSQAEPAEMDRVSTNASSETARGGSPRQRQSPDVKKHHTSDSGIGSTISTASENGDDSETRSNNRSGIRRAGAGACLGSSVAHLSTSHIPSAGIKPSMTSIQSVRGRHGRLSRNAIVQMREKIIIPLLKQGSLKHFHPLVREAPQRITHGDIICLRDLEKFLIHLAQTRAKSVSLYLEFCEMSIRCVQETVNSISEHEQRRPYDRPYTDGYFVDLVDQIGQYAREVNASKERQAAGEEANENDYSPSEKLVLQGGLSQTGRPAELVRVKNGKTIRIGTDMQTSDEHLTEEESKFRAHTMKRQLSEHSSDEEFSVLRSMARRRKVSPQAAKEVSIQTCEECGKQFKRPCDLTKHEKTHSRPWKCSDPTCKYSTHGWPTEKERDRHVNDKHSDTPALYECHFTPCTYRSKRESNCKQHMEKAHGWEYVRSKKTRGVPTGRPNTAEAHTPETAEITTPVSSICVTTPMTRLPSYGNDAHGISPGDYSMAGSISGSEGDASYGGNVYEEAQPSYPTQTDAFSFNDYQPTFNTTSAYIQPYVASDAIVSSTSANTTGIPGTLDDSLVPCSAAAPNIYDSIDWSSLNVYCDNIQTFQLLTPDNSAGQTIYDSFDQPANQYNATLCSGVPQHHIPHIVGLSPNAQANLVLYSPESANEITDEGYDEFLGTSGKPIGDFQLFPSSSSGSSDGMSDGMFPTFRPPMNAHSQYPQAGPVQAFEYPIPWEED
ncbi:MAG: copper-binding transcription factor [Geoglossum umbratile]|nr:MAG: copper-binding transcription factor [Geoglossum umbratile]